MNRLLDNSSLSQPLEQALQAVHSLLADFATGKIMTEIALAFGDLFNVEALEDLLQPWADADFESLPEIEIRSAAAINGANGAFSETTNTVYLAQEHLTGNTFNLQPITNVLLEEIGHFIDSQINDSDAPGDEGAIFSALVQGVKLDKPALQPLKTEDDSVVLTLDGQVVQLEQATAGVNPAFDLIGLTQLRNTPQFAGIDGSGLSVAVIDTGLDRTHPLLQPNYLTGIDFINGGDNPVDLVSHGTHVSGTVGASNENIGVAPDVGLIGLQVFQVDGSGNAGAPNPAIEDALEWVLDNRQQYNIVAVNMSLGGGFYTSESEVVGDILSDDILRLEEAGITVVSAAGNSFKDNEYQNFGAPAIFSTLAVGAVWQDGVNSNVQFGSGAADLTTGADRVTSFSQRLDAPNTIFAPGALINSTVPGGGQEENAGTSMASPMVAGTVALMQEAALQFGGRLLSPGEVVDIIRSTADSIFDGDDEDDNVTNTAISYPRLNVYNAITEIRRIFRGVAPPPPGNGAGDPNGTIEGAFLGPALDGSPVDPLLGSIGTDGSSTNVGDTDVDIFRFEVLSRGEVAIELGSNTDNSADFDTLLRLFDQSGEEIASNDDIEQGNAFSSLSVSLDPGVYFAGVSGFDNGNYNPNTAGSGVAGATGNYSLQFSLGNADPNGLISGAVPVNLGTAREPLLFNGLIGADLGVPTGVADVDLFELQVPDNGTLFIDIDTPFSTDYVDSFLRIFDADGNELTFSDDAQSSDALGNLTEFTDSSGIVFDLETNEPVGHRTDSFVGGTVSRGDTYYIGVSDYFNDSYNPNNLNNRPATGTGGNYDLTVTFINNDQNGSITQALDTSIVPLPVTRQPGTIGADTNFQTGQLLEVGRRDVDFIKINSATAGILEINIDSYSNTTITDPVDTVALLFNADGNLLASDDDTASRDPLLQFQIQADTDYFVAVTGFGNDNFNPFQLGSGSPGDTGEYIFNSRLLPRSQARSLSDNAAGNGAVENVSVGSEIFGSVGEDDGFSVGANDIDIYRFVPTTSGTINIRTSTTEEFSADTFLRFFDAKGNQIAANNNQNNTTRGSFLQATVTAGTEYLIGVNGASDGADNYDPITGRGAANGSQGAYTLSISRSNTGNETSVGSDFNNDNQTDILWRNRATGQNAIWLMEGTTLDQSVLTTSVTDPNWSIGSTGDFNGDAQTDILWRNGATGQNTIWLMDGTTLAQGVSLTPVAGSNWSIGSTGDFNGDAQTDILWRNGATGQNTIWLMDGTRIDSNTLLDPAPVDWQIGG